MNNVIPYVSTHNPLHREVYNVIRNNLPILEEALWFTHQVITHVCHWHEYLHLRLSYFLNCNTMTSTPQGPVQWNNNYTVYFLFLRILSPRFHFNYLIFYLRSVIWVEPQKRARWCLQTLFCKFNQYVGST